MPITAVQLNEAMGDGPPSISNAAANVPAWMVARRERQTGSETVEADVFAEAVVSAAAPEIALTFSTPPKSPTGRSSSKLKAVAVVPVVTVEIERKDEDRSFRGLLAQWFSRQTMIGMGVSLLFHTIVLLTLAFIIIRHVSKQEELSLFGVSEDGEVGGDFLIDTSLPNDAGEAAPLQLVDMGQVIDALDPSKQVAQSTHVGTGGQGKGEGESGEGTGIGVGSLKIPGHAQTKGNFSAWPDPRDPKPGQTYYIVIQIRLPRAASSKKYRGSDLSGLVVGTDKYRQEIRFKADEKFAVVDGAVEVRILVPGGAQRVRDTVNIESKLLREKQTFEIEF